MALGPIPASKIKDYAANELGLERDSDEADRFFDLICRLDNEDRSEQGKSISKKPTEIAPDDTAGVLALFQTIKNRKKHEKKRAARKERTKR